MSARVVGIDPTGSSLDRIARCPASAALPQVFDGEGTLARMRGTVVHAFLERVAEVGREAALAEVDERWRDLCASIEIARISAQLEMSTEVAIAYNWRDDTARILQPLDKRLYEIDEESEVAATLDVVGVSESSVYVGDYKGPYGWLPDPKQSMQLGVGALAFARIYAKASARVEYIRIRDDGSPYRFDAQLDVFGLEAAAERIQSTMQFVVQVRVAVEEGRTPNVTEGPWCKHCPARIHCPAKTALIRSVATQPAPLSLREPLTPATAAAAYAQYRRWKDAFSMLEGAFYAYAKATPIQVGTDDGAAIWFGEFTREGNEQIDGAVAHRVLAERYGEAAATQAVSMECTKKAITDLVRAHKPAARSLKAEQEAVLAAIEDQHGIRRPLTTTTTEYVIAPDGKAKQHRHRRKAS